MNRQRLIGQVAYLKQQAGTSQNGREWYKWNFVLSCFQNGIYNNIPCSTFSRTVGMTLQDGLTIELVEYIPTNRSWEDKQTGQKKHWFDLNVLGIAVVGVGENGDTGYVENATNIPQQQQPTATTYQQPQQQPTNDFNVAAAVDIANKMICDECNKEPCECEVVSWDDLDDLTANLEKTFIFQQTEQKIFTEFLHHVRDNFNLSPSVSIGNSNEYIINLKNVSKTIGESLDIYYNELTKPKAQVITNPHLSMDRVNEINKQVQQTIDTSERVIELSSANEKFEE